MAVKTEADVLRVLSGVFEKENLSVNPEEILNTVKAQGEYNTLLALCAKAERPEKEVVGLRDVLEKRGDMETINDLAARIPQAAGPYEFDLKGSVEMIRSAFDKDEPITIAGDYDVDGVTGSSLMLTGLLIAKYFDDNMGRELQAGNFAQVMDKLIKEHGDDIKIRIPLRFDEGFGLNPVIIDEIDSGLVITVDNGIAANEAIEKAKEKGLTVLVTDHHEPRRDEEGNIILPKADCIIDPNADKYNEKCGYSFTDYCGAGVALKICEGLLGKKNPAMPYLISMASVATIADVMPLHGANRGITRLGADYISKGKCPPGLTALFLANGITPSDVPQGLPASMYITGDMIGYKIGPCINADSRMNGNCNNAVGLMMATNSKDAKELADKLVASNSQRRTVTQQEEFEVRRIIAREKLKEFLGLPHNTCPFVIHLPDSGPGIIGLHAGRICEEERVPAIVINGTGDECKGSGRAPESVNLKEMLDDPSISSYMVKYGGHAGAAGLTIKESEIPAFTKALSQYCIENDVKPLDTKTVYYDIAIDARDIPAALQILQKLAPFGEGNPEPVFKIENFEVENAQILGQKGTLKLTGEYADAIGFGMANGMDREDVMNEYGAGTNHTVIGRLSYNCFHGMMTPQVIFDHIDLTEERFRGEQDIEAENEEHDDRSENGFVPSGSECR